MFLPSRRSFLGASLGLAATPLFAADPPSELGIWGDQFYPNWLMDAYVFPHRDGGWSEGDSLGGAINHSVVLSDSTGAVPVTDSGWVTPDRGSFDIVIDYNNDGKFTWKLDGLASFSIVTHDITPP